MNPINIALDPNRADYARVLTSVASYLNQKDPTKGLTAADIANMYQIVPHVLAAKQDLDPVKGEYVFDHRVGSESAKPNEIKLERSGLFYVTGFAVHIRKFDTAGDNSGNYVDYPYVDATYFNGGAGSESKALNNVFDGRLFITNSNLQLLPGFWLGMQTTTPESQVVSAAPLQNRMWGESDEKRGFRGLTPNFILDGEDDITSRIVLASGVRTNIDGKTAPVIAGTANAVWLRFYGFRVSVFGGGGMNSKACY
jgi:hypothetical protein